MHPSGLIRFMPYAFNTRHNLYGKSYEEVSDIVFANRAQQQPPRVEPGQPHQPRRTTGAPATDKQLRFIDSLLTQAPLPADQLTAARHRLDSGITAAVASKWIDRLIELRDSRTAAPTTDSVGAPPARELPEDLARVVADLELRAANHDLNEFGQSLFDQYRRRGSLSPKQIAAYLRGMDRYARAAERVQAADLPKVPKGRYAVDGEKQTAFYRVGFKQDGRLVLHVKAGPAEHVLPYNEAQYRTILQQILDQGIREGMARYGQELGHCGRCGLELTDAHSREIGLGPDCAKLA